MAWDFKTVKKRRGEKWQGLSPTSKTHCVSNTVWKVKVVGRYSNIAK
jgi:hypothetical protein